MNGMMGEDRIIHNGVYATVKNDFAHNGVEIYFKEFPQKDIRESLKMLGWRWFKPKKCWYNRFNEENKQIAIKIAGAVQLEEDDSNKTPNFENDYFIGIEDIVVISRGAVCIYNDHPLEKVVAWVNVLTEMSLKEIAVPVFHCMKCDVYYMMELDFKGLKGRGHIMCRMIEDTEYQKIAFGNNKWAPVSVMRSYGYTVNSNEDLSDGERQRLLLFLATNGVMTKPQIISFLTWLITRSQSNPRMRLAIEKWTSDRTYVMDSMEASSSIRVRSIYRKNRILETVWDRMDEELPL